MMDVACKELCSVLDQSGEARSGRILLAPVVFDFMATWRNGSAFGFDGSTALR